MSGRLYDQSGKATCKKCGSDMWLSSETNFNGPRCKNKKCDGGLLEAEYDLTVATPGTFMFHIKDYENFLNESKEDLVSKIFSELEDMRETTADQDSESEDWYWNAVTDNGRLKYLQDGDSDWDFFQELKKLPEEELKKMAERIENIRGHLHGKKFGL